jgi:indolepyruvate ferredoxin oxidoreductase beta subunit
MSLQGHHRGGIGLNTFNLLIVGVGGQGGLTLSRILAQAAVFSGLSVRTGETLGMAQRGGSVQSFVRIGKDVRSPIFSQGGADALIGLEALEAARAAPYLRAGSLALVDFLIREPLTTLTRKQSYPPVAELMAIISSTGCTVREIHAHAEASRLGSARSANALMLGAFCKCTELLPISSVETAIETVLTTKSGPAIRAFRRGLEIP